MAPCYVVFEGYTPGIYFTWHECSLQVLGYSNARYKKYQNYEQALHDYNTSLRAATPACAVGGWKNVVIVALFLLVVALWMRLTMSG